jgi:hypothetical protein
MKEFKRLRAELSIASEKEAPLMGGPPSSSPYFVLEEGA